MSHARRVLDYYEWLVKQGVPYGFDLELAQLCAKDGNDAPTAAKRERILPTLQVLALVREAFGPTTINSGYRAPAYNARIGGAKNSRHTVGDAIDFKCRDGNPQAWAHFLRGLRDDGVFTGGIGTYRTFVHVDTRGTNADWRG
jgi:uncharacterized protein YcbK (DUF882 family)